MQSSAPLLLAALAALGSILVTSNARAECANQCELTAQPPVVEPALACSTWETLPQTCGCAVLLDVRNNCAEPIEAVDFSFTSCSAPGANASNCTTLDPGARGSLFLKLNDTGTKRWTFHARSGGVEHTVTFGAEVKSFPSGGCGCATNRAMRGPAIMGLAAAAVVLTRRRGRSSRRQGAGSGV